MQQCPWNHGNIDFDSDGVFPFSLDGFNPTPPLNSAGPDIQYTLPLPEAQIRPVEYGYGLPQHCSPFEISISNCNDSDDSWISNDGASIIPSQSRSASIFSITNRNVRNSVSDSFTELPTFSIGAPVPHVLNLPDRAFGGQSSSRNESSSCSMDCSPIPTRMFSGPTSLGFYPVAVLADGDKPGKGWEDFAQTSLSGISPGLQTVSHHGLPSSYMNSPLASNYATSKWGVPYGTVSPHSLSLEPRSVGPSSSDLQTKQSSASTPSQPTINTSVSTVPQKLTRTEQATEVSSQARDQVIVKPRRKLPSAPIGGFARRILPKNASGVVKTKKNTPQPIEANHHNTTLRCMASGKTASSRKYPIAPQSQISTGDLEELRIIDPPSNASEYQKPQRCLSDLPVISQSLVKEIPCLVAQRRDDLDQFLVKSKQAGLSYKAIRLQGGFTEAESTLRGRFRTLTKKKDERVRRPEWDDNDIRLLKKAVRKLSHGIDPLKMKTPWKQVADYIYEHGGSYRFGNATCRKQWDQLQLGPAGQN